jgi:hypothetical protein
MFGVIIGDLLQVWKRPPRPASERVAGAWEIARQSECVVSIARKSKTNFQPVPKDVYEKSK